jgi:serine/threonine-protein phosphatase 2A activator
VLFKAGALSAADAADAAAAALHTFADYIEFMRLLQSHYRLEPAGSHGVWGLDDFHHVPFILGAAQMSGLDAPDAVPHVPTDGITTKALVEQHSADYFYLGMIRWIADHKRGPFHEHSSVLYNVSGVETWDRIRGGMMKMFDGEVLHKFNIVQHLLFGEHFPLK